MTERPLGLTALIPTLSPDFQHFDVLFEIGVMLFVIVPIGLFIGINGLSIYELILVGFVCVAGFIIGIIPGYRVYRYSLADGMTVKL